MSSPEASAEAARVLHFLVVDDDQVDLLAARRAIKSAYPQSVITEARDAEEALAEMHRARPHCVFLDLRLPGRDGLSVLKHIRGEGSDLPVIVLTGHGDEATAVEIMKAGASDYIPKALLSEQQVLQSVRHALRVREAEAGEREARARLEHYADQMRRVTETAHALNAMLSTESVARTLADNARLIVGARVALVRVLSSDGRGELHEASLASDLDASTTDPEAGVLADALSRIPRVQRVSAADLRGDQLALARSLALELPLRGWLVCPLCGPGGKPIGILHASDKTEGEFSETDEIVVTQLSQIGAVAIENARLFEQAKQAARARDDMVAVVSHDLRNPLNTIVMASSLLLGKASVPPSNGTDHLKRIQRAARRMQALVSDLLDVTRIEAGQLALTREPQQIASLVDEAIELVSGAAAEKQIVIDKRLPDVAPPVHADRERILQVFSNLLGNAIKFTPTGGTICMRATICGESVAFCVEDHGPGIPREHLPHLFDRLWQAPSAAKSKVGTGLGLFIAKGIVDAHDGNIWVESEPGRGTQVSFALACARESAA